MPVRLSKVARDLNVGLQTIVDFLTKQSKSVENSPNFKISWEDYLLLAKEFNKEVYEKLLREREIRKAQKKEEELAQKNKKDPNKDRKKGEELVGEKVQLVSDIKVLGTIDLNSPSPKIKKENPVTSQEKKQEQKVEPKQEEKVPVQGTQEVVASSTESDVPKQEQVEKNIPKKESSPENSKPSQKEKKVEKSGAQIQKNTPKKDGKKKDNTSTKPSPKAEDVKSFEEALPKLKGEEEIFTLSAPKIGQNINVIGKIDLDKLNQSSRPKPKTKEEKRKERIQREKERKASSQGAKNSKSPENKPSSTVEGNDGKKKRNRFQKGKVDINNPSANKPAPEEKKEKKGEKIDKRSRNDKNRDQREERENKGGKNRDKFDQKKGKKNSFRPEINEEDIQKQVKETLNRLTNKPTKQKGVKYRKEKREAFAQHQQEQMEVASNESKVLKITEFVTVNDLAMMMNVPVNKVIGTCMSVGLMVSINMRLDAEAINLVAEEFGFRTEYVSADVSNTIEEEEEGDEGENLVPRSPIVTIMGHVDHGKTSLLDHIRNTNVIAGEAGGITQHIGAYSVTLQNGKSITFLDTPGHEAFTAMRARGAKITDIAVIIVAADDDVMPQTIEAINHASAANVPMVFAINKIDKPAANPDKIKEALAKMNYLIEEWGGKYQSQDISAKKGLGVRELLDKILLEAEILDLKANPNKKAVGSILESSLDKGRGYVATVLVQTGTLKVGDYILAGTHYGRVKAMFNERNQRLQSAGPSEPVQILGLNGAPQAGDKLNVMETEQEVRSIATKREQLQREQGLRTQKHLTLEDLGRRIAIGNFQELNLIVKGDVDGSVEAIADSFIKLSTKEIQVNVIHKAVGQISESDVILAAASNAIIIGFQVRPSASARKLAEQEEVDIRLYSIIYKAIEEVQAAMEGMLAPEVKEEITATVEIKETFKISKVGTIAGCIVKEGKIKRTSKVRCIRDGIVVYTGELGSLKRFKDDAKEVTVGLECGLSIANFNDIKVGDVIEAYEEIEVKKTLQ